MRSKHAGNWPQARLTNEGDQVGVHGYRSPAGLYYHAGKVWRVCPRLLELDPRHGKRHDQWPGTWRDPTHAEYLASPEVHVSNLFVYVPGSIPESDAEWPVCSCGRVLVCSDGDPI